MRKRESERREREETNAFRREKHENGWMCVCVCDKQVKTLECKQTVKKIDRRARKLAEQQWEKSSNKQT